MSVELLAIDLGKRSFHIHGVDRDGVIISRKTRRPRKLTGTLRSYGADHHGARPPLNSDEA
jgi:hypothetical protein